MCEEFCEEIACLWSKRLRGTFLNFTEKSSEDSRNYEYHARWVRAPNPEWQYVNIILKTTSNDIIKEDGRSKVL